MTGKRVTFFSHSIDEIKFKWYRIDQFGQETEVNETSSGTGKSMLKFNSLNDTDYTCLVYSESFGIFSNATRTVSYKVFGNLELVYL